MAEKKKRPSFTAKGIAGLRAVESERPADERICFDPLARRMISPAFYLVCRLSAGYGRKVAPGTQEFLAVRTRFIDDFLEARLADGIEQLVILGAGLDTRAYRLAEAEDRVRVFEVDHPASQRAKLRMVERALGGAPRNVGYVAVDFDHEGLEKLFGCGFQENAKTLFIWEGVTYYLSAEGVDATLGFVKKHSGVGSSIVFDYIQRSALDALHKRGEVRRMQRYSGLTGEGLVFGIEDVRGYLAARGFSRIENATAEDLRKAYLVGKRRADPIAEVYALATAWT